jgi:hypothetical protein
MASPRTYSYIQALLKRGTAARAVEYMRRDAAYAAEFDVKYAKELVEAWAIVESAADRGAVRIFARDHLVFQNKAIQNYFVARGFGWNSGHGEGGALEWWFEPKDREMK